MIYPPNQKPPIWSINPGVIAYNCQKAGMPRPVFTMPMWEGAGNRVMDYSRNGNHGTINGAEWNAERLSFIAANSDYVECGTSPAGGLSEITVMTRSKRVAIDSNAFLISDGSAYNTNAFYVSINAGKPLALVCSSSYDYRKATSDASTTEFVDIGFSWKSGTRLKLYVDGAIAPSTQFGSNQSGTLKVGDGNLIIGAQASSPPVGHFNGDIFYSIIYNQELSASQIKFLHENPYFMYQMPEELYGYVAAVGGGWTGEIIGITNPSEILGRATSGISEVNGL